MGALDQVTNLKNQGFSNQEIINNLQEQGISPKEITDALNQAKIKSAVSGNGKRMASMQPSILRAGEGDESEPNMLPTEGGISDEDLVPPTPGGPLHPTREIDGQDMYEPQPSLEQQYSPSPYQATQEYAPEESYPAPEYQYQYAPQDIVAGISDTDTMIEIAEQVFSEKVKQIQKKIDELNEFKTISQIKLDNASEKLKRIEAIIDDLQTSILEKVGSYGEGLESVKREMNMIEDSFSKVVGKLSDKEEKHHYTQGPSTTNKARKVTRKR